MKTRVKICGITSLVDAQQAIEAGASALGFVFYEPSPRYIEPEDAARIIKSLPPFVTIVGLFVDAETNFLKNVLEIVPLDLIQFHGNESDEHCSAYKLPYIKAVRVKDGDAVTHAFSAFPGARAILFDAYKPGVPGGTGEVFNWDLLPSNPSKPIIVAGGLTPENVGQAIKALKPFAVDVSGGVELDKGVKDHSKVSNFIVEVSRVCEFENN